MTLQGALAKAQWPNPYRKQRGAQLLWGKVSGRHPERGTVDVTLDRGTILPDVPVLPQALGQLTADTYLPVSDPVTPQATPQGPYGLPTPNPDPTANTLYAVVGWLEGSGRQPVVIGFLPTRTSAVAPQTPGWQVQRHESGTWHALDPAGNLTMGWPDGSTLSVTTTGTPANPPQDINPQWPATTGSDVQVQIRLASGASVAIQGGQIILNNGTAGVARVGDSVQVDVGGTIYTGTITSGSTRVLSG